MSFVFVIALLSNRDSYGFVRDSVYIEKETKIRFRNLKAVRTFVVLPLLRRCFLMRNTVVKYLHVATG